MIDISSDAISSLKAMGLDTVEQVLECRGDRVAALSRTSEIVQVTRPVDGKPVSLFIKRYRYPQWKRRLKLTFRGSLFGQPRARYERDMLVRMRQAGIPAVRLMAYGERRICGFIETAILITEAESGSVSLDAFVRNRSDTPLPPPARHALVRGLAQQVKNMHAAGITHGGLVWRNILVRPDNTKESGFVFHFLDPAPIRLKDPKAREARDLAELGAMAKMFCTKTDFVRFVTTYLNNRKITADQRPWLADIDTAANELVDQEKHRLEVRDAIAAFEQNWMPKNTP